VKKLKEVPKEHSKTNSVSQNENFDMGEILDIMQDFKTTTTAKTTKIVKKKESLQSTIELPELNDVPTNITPITTTTGRKISAKNKFELPELNDIPTETKSKKTQKNLKLFL